MIEEIQAGRARAATPKRLAQRTHKAISNSVRAGAISYDRKRDLPALIRLDPFAPLRDTPEEMTRIVSKLRSALRAERNRARAGHWTYDLNRHIALRQAFLAETERQDALAGGSPNRIEGPGIASTHS